MKNGIKFVYFDIGGVVFRWKNVMEEIAKKHGKLLKEVESAFGRYDAISCRGQITSEELWEKMAGDLKLKTDDGFSFISFSMEQFSPIVETHDFIREIRKKVRIGLLTNIHPGVYRAALARKHIPEVDFAAVVQSCEIGMVKPEKEIYLYAQKAAKADHSEILFADDLAVNVEAAGKLGWKTVLFETDHPERSLLKIREMIG